MPRQHTLLLGRGPQRAVPAASVDALFHAQARRTPAASALRHGRQQLSYAQLDQRVESLAHELLTRGVGAGALVALCLPRGLELVVAMLAIMRSGAAYVPIDPEAPAARIRTILQDSAPRLTLAGASFEAALRELDLPWMALEGTASGARPRTLASGAQPDALAYVIFTSGSTGTPKGVEVRQVSLVNHALAMAELYAIGPSDSVLFSASVGFDVAAEQIYPALISGAEVVVRPEDLFSSFERFDQQLRAASITALMLPTAFFHEWTRELDAGRLELPPALRVLGVGTEAVSSALLGRFLEHAGGRVRFLQGYGPTETTITCTAYVHDGRSFAPGEVVPIGLPLPNTEAYVLDEHMAPVADGEVGELYVGGVGLARGYLGRPELTRERFIPNPFAAEPGPEARLYRTGDLVRRGVDGQLAFVGRADFQIKVRGHRVEPSEIERVLGDQPGISEALVMLRQREQGAPRLVAYVVSELPLDCGALAAACRAQLPAYMVPDAYVALAAFPKTLNQKIDRSALPDPAPLEARAKRAARNDLELLLVRAFGEVLGISEPCIEDDFFALGGSSLRALRLLQLIRQSCSAQLGLADIFAAPSVAALSARIARGGTLDRATVLCLKPGRGTPLFLVCGIHIYQRLADALTAPNPVYALLLPSEASLAGEGPALPAIERLAFEYLQVLREHTPRGPYALGGLSFGGAVAYEMARQLDAAGERVAVVGLFDTALPRGRLRSAQRWLRRRLRGLLTRAVRELAPSRATASDAHPLLALEQRRQRAYGERLVDYDRASKPYAGRVVLYRALHANEGPLLPGHGFEQLAPRLALCDIPGDHLTILSGAGVHQLAAHLSCEIAQTSSPGA